MITVYKDPKTLERIELLHPKLREEGHKIYDEICHALTGKAICRFAYTLRTFAEQNIIYAQGRTSPGAIVTDAKAGQSYHNYGLAIDVVLLLDLNDDKTYETASWDFKTDFDGDKTAEWKEIEAIFLKYGWKGLFNKRGERYDLPHFQKTLGYTIAHLQELYKQHNKMYLPL